MLQRVRVYTHGVYNYYFGSLDGTMHNVLRSTKAGGSRTAWTDCVFCTQSAYDWYCGYLDNTYPYDARLYRWRVQVLQRVVWCYNALQCPARRYNARYEVTMRSTIVWSYNARYNVPMGGSMFQCAVRCYDVVRCYNARYDVTMVLQRVIQCSNALSFGGWREANACLER